MAVTHIWQMKGFDNYIVACKGAPESVIDLCDLNATEKQDILFHVTEMAVTGLKILAIARGTEVLKSLPENRLQIKYKFLGLIGFNDPIRPSIPRAITQCYQAGINIIMVTGDYPGTARYIASKIGLKNFEKVVTGQELSKIPETELRQLVQRVNVFARITPEEKLRLVGALKANGEVVAMTGDGVNDAPALKAAHIGIALGGSSTDVAREAASLILLNGDFASLVETVKLGRRIYDNIKRAMMYVLAIHIPIAGIALIPPLSNLPLVLYPIHIVFLELIIDPVSSIAFEATEGDKDIMTKPPRKLNKPFLNNNVLLYSLIQGLIILIGCIGVMLITWYLHLSPNSTRTITYVTLIISNLGLMLVNLNGPENIWHSISSTTAPVKWILSGTAILLTVIVIFPLFRNLFSFAELRLTEILICMITSLFIIICIETFELISKRKGIIYQSY